MNSLELIKTISRTSGSKIIFLILDGIGGLPDPVTGKTELETAHRPNLNRLSAGGICGLIDPVGMGITPGSASGHLAVFGYDPLEYNSGRGALEAVGIDFDLRDGDVAARGNFCTVDEQGLITDRRAGRISTEKCTELCRLLDGQEVDNVKVLVRPVREHRFVAVFRGKGLASGVTDSDPQQIGLAPKIIAPLRPEAEHTASVANKFIAGASVTLHNNIPANMMVLRGFSVRPRFPAMADIYKLKAAAIALYPMYRGLARLLGMEILSTGNTIEEEFQTLQRNYKDYDFFFLHIKPTDAAGEDGDFARKVKAIEQVDNALKPLLSLEPDVIVVTGDHSTPALLKGHSWHPVPFLLHARWCRPDDVKEFSERDCLKGALGRFPATQIMPLAMANALRLGKYGA